MIRTLAALATLVLAVQPADAAPIEAKALSAHVKVLASDEFEGRAPGTPGEDKSVAYIVDQFRKAGLAPGGDNGGWTQALDLWRIETALPHLTVRAGATSFNLTNGKELAMGARSAAPQVVLANAPLVFVGYGVTAPERKWDDFKGVDLKGKIAVFLVNDPDFETPEANTFDGKAMTYYGRWTYKFEEAARRGAAGALVIHEDGPAGYGFASLARSWLQPQYEVIRADEPPRPLIESWITRDAAAKIFSLAGADFEGLKASARSRDFHPVQLTGVGVSANFPVKRSKTTSHNVIGILPGTRFADETVLYTAHWDHLGRTPDGVIYSGAVDNASGVAGLIELAYAFGRAPRTARTVQFIAFTAEEKGLLGSAYYASKPTRPLETTALVLNMDSLSSIGRAKDLAVTSRGRTNIDDLIDKFARTQDRTAIGDPTPETGNYFRSDHLALAQKGVPGVVFGISRDLLDGGKAVGDAAYQDYVLNRYHGAADKWRADMNLFGAAEDVSVLYETGATIANTRTWPVWSAGEAFKTIRDTSAARRPQ